MSASSGVWHVFFTDVEARHVWSWITRRGFQHCFAMKWCPDEGHWLSVEWGSGRFFFEMHSYEDGLLVHQYVSEQGGSCVSFPSANTEKLVPFWKTIVRPPLYCVSTITDLLGVSFWSLTPYRLWCALKARGGLVIFEPEGDQT